MLGEQILGVCGIVVAITALRALSGWHRERSRVRVRRYELLAESLRDPGLDAATRADLLRVLAHDHRGWLWQALRSPALWKVLWFGSGWFLFVLCSAMVGLQGCGLRLVASHELAVLVVPAAVGFAMLSLPLALRELARRDHGVAGR